MYSGLDGSGGPRRRLVTDFKNTCMYFLLGRVHHDEILHENLDGPCPAPSYLPTYLPYLWETKKEITGWVKVGYHTN